MSATLKVLRTDDDRRLHPYCQECKKATEAQGKNWRRTISRCQGIYSSEDFNYAANTTGMPVQEIRELMDPGEWIKNHLMTPDAPYWYQDRGLRCTSIRKALRWGRRTGKTEMMAAFLLYAAFTNAGVKILCVTPMKPHAKEILDRLNKFLDVSSDLKSEVTRQVQQPYYETVFANGSRIRLFIGGTTSGKNAGAQIRGQEADIMFIDEMDYLDDDATTAILPILSDPKRQENPVTLIVSSTPTGREDLFFKMCHDGQYKEFHFPSQCRPDWDDDKEAEARNLAKTEAGYQHEYLAEWGTKEDGVFRRKDIIRAAQPYRYHSDPGFHETKDWPEMKPFPHHWKYIMGVDWHGPGNGTRISIVGYDFTRNKWMIVYREAVSVDEFSYHFSVDRVVQLNRLWKCHAIYIDAGHGQMQDETLRGIGRAANLAQIRGQDYNSADLILADHLHKIDFGSKLTYYAMEEGRRIKQEVPTKNYMVENFQRFFENDDFWFSKADQDLREQLMGYSTKGETTHGHATYKPDPSSGDHDLDATMLALFGFAQEFDPMFKKPSAIREFLILPQFGRPHEPITIDPLSDPIAYEHELRERGQQRKYDPTDIPSRDISKQKPKIEIYPGMLLIKKPGGDKRIARSRSGRAHFQSGSGRNSWLSRNTNGRRIQ